MQDWWLENGPPVYMSVAGYLGLIKASPKRYSRPGGGDYSNLNELARRFEDTGGLIQ